MSGRGLAALGNYLTPPPAGGAYRAGQALGQPGRELKGVSRTGDTWVRV